MGEGDQAIWQYYINEAEKVDREMIKDWHGSLNTLLIFVSFFPFSSDYQRLKCFTYRRPYSRLW